MLSLLLFMNTITVIHVSGLRQFDSHQDASFSAKPKHATDPGVDL